MSPNYLDLWHVSSSDSSPFFLSDNSIWCFPFVSSLSDYSIWRSWSLFSLAIIAFGAFGFIVPKYFDRQGNMDKRSLDSLISGGWMFPLCVISWQCWEKSADPYFLMSAFLSENWVPIFRLLSQSRASLFGGLWPKNRVFPWNYYK